jgi:hypothetical protein
MNLDVSFDMVSFFLTELYDLLRGYIDASDAQPFSAIGVLPLARGVNQFVICKQLTSSSKGKLDKPYMVLIETRYVKNVSF